MPRSLVETCLRRKPVYLGNCVNFYVDDVRLPNGRTAQREYLDHPGAAAVVPFLDERTILLVRQYRYPVRLVTYEIPAGKLDGRESPRRCLERELQEETGYTARRLRPLLSYWPTPAFSDELLHVYVATGLKAGRARPDEDEFLEPVCVPFRRALGWVRSGRIRDSKTVIALLACALSPGIIQQTPVARPPRGGGRSK